MTRPAWYTLLSTSEKGVPIGVGVTRREKKMNEVDFPLTRYSVRTINACLAQDDPVFCQVGSDTYRVTKAAAPRGILQVRCDIPQKHKWLRPERIWRQLVEKGEAPGRMRLDEDEKMIALSDPHAYLLLTAHVNLLELTQRERAFIKALLDLVDRFEREQRETQEEQIPCSQERSPISG